MSAPTGQIWTVLPLKYESNGSPAAMPTCCNAPRSSSSMNGSPAIWLENRVQRAHNTQRSRSSSTSVDRLSGLGKVRLMSVKRVSVRPLDMAWFCSGHSPPLSHTGQSRGWLISSSSITLCCAASAAAEVHWVRTTMPSVTVVVQLANGLRWPSTSTRHCRQAPTGSSSGWSQNRGIWTPIISAARITKVPLGTESVVSSMVMVTSSTAGVVPVSAACVMRPLPRGRTASMRTDQRGSRRPGAPRTRRGSTASS